LSFVIGVSVSVQSGIDLFASKKFGNIAIVTGLLHALPMGVAGLKQRDRDKLQILAKNLEYYSPLLGRLSTESRDFR